MGGKPQRRTPSGGVGGGGGGKVRVDFRDNIMAGGLKTARFMGFKLFRKCW